MCIQMAYILLYNRCQFHSTSNEQHIVTHTTIPNLYIAKIMMDITQRWALRKLVVDAWHIRTCMALYTEAGTVVRTDAGLSESFEVKVGLRRRRRRRN